MQKFCILAPHILIDMFSLYLLYWVCIFAGSGAGEGRQQQPIRLWRSGETQKGLQPFVSSWECVRAQIPKPLALEVCLGEIAKIAGTPPQHAKTARAGDPVAKIDNFKTMREGAEASTYAP